MAAILILPDYSVKSAEVALKANGFISKGATGGDTCLWEHPPFAGDKEPYRVRIRAKGELDANSRSRLERTLKEIRRREAEEKQKENLPTFALRPPGLPRELEAFTEGNVLTVADSQPPFFSLHFNETTNAGILENAAKLIQISAPAKSILAKAGGQLRADKRDGEVRLILPEAEIESPALDLKAPDYLQRFSEMAETLLHIAPDVKKARDHYQIAFTDEGNALQISQPDFHIDSRIAKNLPNALPLFAKSLSKALDAAHSQTEDRLRILAALDKVSLNGEPLRYHLEQADSLQTATAGRIMSLEQGMTVPFYGDSVIPRQTVHDLERQIRLQNFRTGRGVNRHLEDAEMKETFAARFANQALSTGRAPGL